MDGLGYVTDKELYQLANEALENRMAKYKRSLNETYGKFGHGETSEAAMVRYREYLDLKRKSLYIKEVLDSLG